MTEGHGPRYDSNTEAFQMRAQWKKAEICRKKWYQSWYWLIEEREKANAECEKIRLENAEAFVKPREEITTTKNLKPVPMTSAGFVGWIASKPDCKLEVYPPWLYKPPLRAPDAWDDNNYLRPQQNLQTDKTK